MAALESKERADFPLLEVAADVFRTQSEREPVRILGDHPARDVDLLELDARVSGVGILAGSVHGPELRSDHPFLQSIEIGVSGGAFAQVVGIHVTTRDRVFTDPPR